MDNQKLYFFADELRSLASEGQHYAQNEYDLARYQHLMKMSARLFAALERRPVEQILPELQGDITRISPVCSAGGVIFRDGKILLMQRNDNNLWGMPGGAINVGESLAEGLQREIREEVGVVGVPTRLLAVFDNVSVAFKDDFTK